MAAKKQSTVVPPSPAKPADRLAYGGWDLTARVLGHDFLMRHAPSLVSKEWFRQARDSAEAELVAVGGTPLIAPDGSVIPPVRLPGGEISGYDIEHMRKAIAKWDAEHSAVAEEEGRL